MIHRFKYLITGYGHSGTGCVARALTSVGIPCTHEGVRKGVFDRAFGAEEYPLGSIQADSNHFMSLPGRLDLPFFEGATIIHLVRDPILVMRSFLDMAANNGAKITERRKSNLALSWVTRNLRVENEHGDRPYHRIRIEDGYEPLMKIVGKLGVTPPFWDAGYNRHYSGKLKLTWNDLPNTDAVMRLRAVATRYGYLCTF